MGDLRITYDIKLHNTFYNGPKFKENKCTDFEKRSNKFF